MKYIILLIFITSLSFNRSTDYSGSWMSAWDNFENTLTLEKVKGKQDASNFDSTINSFKTIVERSNFINNNIEKYASLTPREKETLKFIVKGYTNEKISEKMYISFNTVRTHRNNIWKKLEIKQIKDCLTYQCFFD